MAAGASGFALAAGLVGPLVASAQGGPPLLTDDPDTPGDRRWEINIAHELRRTRDETIHSLPRLDVNYGLGNRVQLNVETGWLVTKATGDGRRSGVDNVFLGLKWRFYDPGEAGFKASVFPQLELENPLHSDRRDIAEPAPNLTLPIEVGKSFGTVRVAGELGYTVTHAEPDEWLYGLVAGHRASAGLELLAEIHGTAERSLSQTDDLILNVGFTRDLNERATLLASVGTGLAGDTERSRFRSYLGLQLHF